MFKDLLNQAQQLLGLAKEAKMESQFIGNDYSTQAQLFKLLREYDQLNVDIGHAHYMAKHFGGVCHSTNSIQIYANNHQAMLLCHKHLTEMLARRDELENHINYLRNQK